MKIKKDGKVVTLTESDLRRIVKRVIMEQETDEPIVGPSEESTKGAEIKKEKLPKEIQDFIKKYNIEATYFYKSKRAIAPDGTIADFVDRNDTFGVMIGNNYYPISVEDIVTYERNKNNQSKCDEKVKYANELQVMNRNIRMKGEKAPDNFKLVDPKNGENWIDWKYEVDRKYPKTEYCKTLGKLQSMIKGGKYNRIPYI